MAKPGSALPPLTTGCVASISPDRAYGQAVGILGPTAEILNNQGYSYMLRGDYKRAHAALMAARRRDPANKFVQNNIRLLEESYRRGKAIQ
jgi:Flp pilus assembly protein TadD